MCRQDSPDRSWCRGHQTASLAAATATLQAEMTSLTVYVIGSNGLWHIGAERVGLR